MPVQNPDEQLFPRRIEGLAVEEIQLTPLVLRATGPLGTVASALSEGRLNAASFCQVGSPGGNFPAAFSCDFHFSVLVCVCV